MVTEVPDCHLSHGLSVSRVIHREWPERRHAFDATISIAHSEKQNAAATWKKPSFHLLLAFLDRSEVAGRDALAGLARQRNNKIKRSLSGRSPVA